MSRYKLVTFDVTNTLLKFRVPPVQQYLKTAKEYGVIVEEERLAPAFKHQWKLLNDDHPCFGCTTGLNSKQWWTKFVIGTFTDAGYKSKDKELIPVAHHLFKLFSTSLCWAVSEGSQDLLTKLKQHKVKMGVVSNFDERLEKILTEMSLRHFFDFVVCSYVAQCGKPDPQIFDLALSCCDCPVKAKEAIHVGDNIDLDYIAARKAGWQSILIQKGNTGEIRSEVDKKFVVGNLSGVESIILGK